MQSVPASHRDLLAAQVATLATISQDGHPQLSELWFLAVDGQVAMSLNTSRQKVKNLRRRPECSVLLLDLANPYRYVEIRGDAEIEADDDYAFADLLGAKYGSDLRAMDDPSESRVVVTVRPTRVRTWGWHRQVTRLTAFGPDPLGQTGFLTDGLFIASMAATSAAEPV